MTKIKIKLLERVPDVFVTLFSIQFDQIVCLYSPHLPLLPSECVCVWGLRESCWFLELVRGQGSLAWVRAICHDTRTVAVAGNNQAERINGQYLSVMDEKDCCPVRLEDARTPVGF